MKVQYNVEIPERGRTNSEHKQILLNFIEDKSKQNMKIECEDTRSTLSVYSSILRYLKIGGYPIKIYRRGDDVFLVKEAADA